MANQKGEKLFDFRIDGYIYSVRATTHALEQMNNRQVSTSMIKKTICQLRPKLIKDLQSINRYVALLNRNDPVTIILGFDGYKIIIITVINTNRYYGKYGTLMIAV